MVEGPGCSTRGAVVVASHNNRRFITFRQIPQLRQWFAVLVHIADEVRQQTLLLVGLRNSNFIEVDVISLSSSEKEVVRPNGGTAVAFLASPGRIALAGIDYR